VAVNTVFGRQISSISGHSALYGSVPMVAVVATISGSSVGAIGLIRERADGLLARLWVLAVHRASGLLSRIVAEAVRILLTTVVILCAGVLLGLRFHQGLLTFLAWLIVPVIFGVAFATFVITVALYSAKTTLVEAISLLNMLAIFFCTGFVPLEYYPQWIQPVVAHQPMSYAVEAMRGLSLGGPILWPMIATLLWAGGIVAVCVVPLMFGYRKASMR
jgi:ABC-2 type transport system permease protein